MHNHLEQLEYRRLMTNIVVTGTSGSDTIAIAIDTVNTNYVDVFLNGVKTQYSAVRSISVSGGAGNDKIDTGTGNAYGDITVPQTLNGDAGNDTIVGGIGNDVIHGGDGDDSLNDYGLNPTLYGDAGNDVLHTDKYQSGTVYLFGGIGADSLYANYVDDPSLNVTYYSYQNDVGNSPDSSVDKIYVKTSATNITNHNYTALGDSDQVINT